MDIILNRRSVRQFSTKEIADEILLDLCQYAEAAPSARNQKSRAYIIINDKKIIEELSNVSEGSKVLKNANKCICVLGKSKDLLTTPEMQDCDLGAAAENILLRATELNIGSCWIGIHARCEREAKVREILNIPSAELPYCLIALGYPLNDNSFFDKNKKPEISYNRR